MILIENKLEMFNDLVYKNRVLELQKEKARWEEESKRLKKEKADNLIQEEEEMVARRKKLARELGNEKIAKAKEEKRVLELRKMTELENDLIGEIRNRVRKWTGEKDYGDQLLEDIKKTLSQLDLGSYKICLTKRDMDKFYPRIEKMGQELGLDLSPKIISDSIIGGHIISDQKESYNLNRDLYSLIEEKRYEIGKLLNNLLRGQDTDE